MACVRDLAPLNGETETIPKLTPPPTPSLVPAAEESPPHKAQSCPPSSGRADVAGEVQLSQWWQV